MLNPKSKFSWGVVVGAVLGGAAAYFLSPRTGKENRDMAKKKFEELKTKMKEKDIDKMAAEIFGKVTEEGKRLYTEARSELNRRLEALKSSTGEVDYSQYKEVVMEVVGRLQGEKEATKDRLRRLQDYLLNRWDTLQDMAEEDASEAVKKAKDKK